ncbi:ABC transporter permease [Desulforhopalus sp. IMCC35007]|uniref:ABC transporter permease n=1 Tax=Desulforhopalus sp. IMCC35007 TaxID=2569543 RepID=UPI0010AEEAD4|nr:ABC transporter permease [Desulforhopalus sp. IMCC35007]TKB09897.1 ABC transporter permease [Desulforhopalus sp. IMCC35007]
MSALSFTAMQRREWRLLLHDPWLFSLITWIPMALGVFLWSIFAQGIARDLPIGVVDLDKSQVSRSIIRTYDASPALQVIKGFADISQGVAELRAGTIYALVLLPENLDKNTTLGSTPEVTAFVNSQFLLIGKVVNSALLQAQSTFTVKVEVKKNLFSGQSVMDAALSSSLPIGTQTTPLFNINTNYAQFLVSAILPALWQILTVALTVLSFAADKRRLGLQVWLADGPVKAVTAKCITLIVVAFCQGALFLSAMYIWLGWPMHGAWSILLSALFLTSVASVSAASLLFLATRDAARGLSLAAAYAAPGLAFMGVTFPVSDMTLPARIWRSLIPISHYIEIQLSQVNYGAPFVTTIPQFKALLYFIVPLLLSLVLAKVVASPRKVAGEVV